MIVVDTHVLLWWVSDPDKLSSRAREAVHYAKQVGVCPISILEVATKVARGKLFLDRELATWVRHALARPKLALLSISPEIAIRAGELSQREFHGDPADRLIAATAIEHGTELVTKDQRIRDFPGVRTIW